MDLKAIEQEFEDFVIDYLAAEYDPENGEYIDLEDIFEYNILGNHDLDDEEYEQAKAWFWDNLERIENKFWKQVENNRKEAESLKDTEEYLNRTFGIY